MSASATPTVPDETEIPTHNETLRKDVLSKSPEDGTRRVRRHYRRVISAPEHITYVNTDDILVRVHNNQAATDTIADLGPDVSCTDGMHIETASGDIIHLNLIRKWIADENAYIVGSRSKEYTELEGVDY